MQRIKPHIVIDEYSPKDAQDSLTEILENSGITLKAFMKILKEKKLTYTDFLERIKKFPIETYMHEAKIPEEKNTIVQIFTELKQNKYTPADLINFIQRIRDEQFRLTSSLSPSDFYPIYDDQSELPLSMPSSSSTSRLRHIFKGLSSRTASLINHSLIEGFPGGLNGLSAAMSGIVLSEFAGSPSHPLDPKVARSMMLSGLIPMALFTFKSLLDRYDPEKKYLSTGRHVIEGTSLFLGTFMFTLRTMIEIYIFTMTEASNEDVDGKYSDLVLAGTVSAAAALSLMHVLLRKYDEKIQKQLQETETSAINNSNIGARLKSRSKILRGFLTFFDGLLFGNIVHSNIGIGQVFNHSYHTDPVSRGIRYSAAGASGSMYMLINPFLERRTAANFLNVMGAIGILFSLTETLFAMNAVGQTLEDEDRIVIGAIGTVFMLLPAATELFNQLGVQNALLAAYTFLSNAISYLNTYYFNRLDPTPRDNATTYSERMPINASTLRSSGYLTLFNEGPSALPPLPVSSAPAQQQASTSTTQPSTSGSLASLSITGTEDYSSELVEEEGLRPPRSQ